MPTSMPSIAKCTGTTELQARVANTKLTLAGGADIVALLHAATPIVTRITNEKITLRIRRAFGGEFGATTLLWRRVVGVEVTIPAPTIHRPTRTARSKYHYSESRRVASCMALYGACTLASLSKYTYTSRFASRAVHRWIFADQSASSSSV